MTKTAADAATKASDNYGATHIGAALNALARTLSRSIDQVTTPEGISVDQWYALDVIVQHDGIAMNDLATILAVPAPTLTKFIDRLVAGALAFRLVDDADRRRVLVHGSARGQAVHRRLSAQITEVENGFLAGFSSREQLNLRRILERDTV
ncbi:MarR family winged helix-turn-helix transcriptional regulator [Gordonia polyisoprenivorans]|uniref:MarR family winged helix-turn-helix transcriptional regulator n=1 Tax=Gordonia polyisoprenivorans TaxID=84595 RepID=UPI001FCB3EDE|nr:MarR family transcriptional regulator [Gordonia polyisoprenivorans]